MFLKNKHLYWASLSLFGVILLMWAHPVYALVPSFVPADTRGQLGIDLKDLVSHVAILNTFMHVIILIALNFVQYLLQSDFFTNPAMMSALNSIWQLSRDVMNILFALMLIGVALYTIVTADKKYVTDKLQTFVIAVILVNFSWFFPRVIIDVANVLTATIYTVPDMLTGGFNCQTWNNVGDPIEPCKAIIDIKILPQSEPEKRAFCPLANDPNCACSDIACYKTGSLAAFRASGSAGAGHVMINGLVVNFVKILELPKIVASVAAISTGTPLSGFMQSLQILMVIGMAFIFQLAIMLPLVGLAIGLLFRILIIWVTTAFMPFVFLGYVVNGKLGTNVFEFEHDIWKEFITAAFIPAAVAVPISIGFIMMTAVTQVPAPLGAFPLSFGIPMFASVRTWWVMLWQMAAIMIVWTGTFAALSKSKIIGGFTEKLKGYGEGIFNTAKLLPLIVPLPLPGGQNLASFINRPRQWQQIARRSFDEGISPAQAGQPRAGQGQNGGPLSTDGLRNLLNAGTQDTNKIVDAIRRINNGGTSKEDRLQAVGDLKVQLQLSGLTNREAMDRIQSVVTGGGLTGTAQTALNTDEIKRALTEGMTKLQADGSI